MVLNCGVLISSLNESRYVLLCKVVIEEKKLKCSLNGRRHKRELIA